MKATALLTLPFLVSGASIKHEIYRRQGLDVFGLSNSELTPRQPVLVKKFDDSNREKAIKERVVWGPFKLKPANADHPRAGFVLKLDQNSDIISTRVTGICKDCMVLNAKADLCNEQGEKLHIESGIYSHHIIMTDIGHPMVAPPAWAQCPNGRPGGFNFNGMVKGAPKDSESSHHGMQRYEAPPPADNATPTSQLASLGLPSSLLSVVPKEPTQVLGGLAGAVIGASLFAALGAVLGGGVGAILSVPGGLNNLANLLPKMTPPQISVFIGQGEEGAGLEFSPRSNLLKSGYWVGAKDEINLMSEVINYNNETRDIYVKLEYEYVPMPSRPAEYYDVGMGAINVAPCESVNLMPPNDRPVKYSSPAWRVMQEGYLLDIKPHLHDGGLNMTFYVNEQPVCTSQAIYGGGDGGLAINGEKWETITSYTKCPDPIPIKLGDSLTMDAYYDLTKHKLRPNSDNKGEAEGMALANYVYARPYTNNPFF